MPPTNTPGKSSLLIFIGILVVGVIATTIAYRYSQVEPPNEPANEEMTLRYEQLASAQGEMSKWLLGIASGALAGLVGLRLKDPQNDALVGKAPMAAYAFLIISLYGAFLSYDATVNILRLGPLTYLYGDQFKFPVLVQFWSLIVALVLLGMWLFRPRTRGVMLLLFLTAVSVPRTNAQELHTKQCVQDWYKDRLKATQEPAAVALDVLNKIERQPGAKAAKTCVDLKSILDRLRFAAIESGNADTQPGFDAYLKALGDELSNPDLSMSEVVHSIIQLMSPWDQQLAVLSIRGSNGTYQILINAKQVGVTPWTRRMSPGTYSIRVVRDFQAAYSSDALQLIAGNTTLIDLDKPKQ
jgi:hypothetical protein